MAKKQLKRLFKKYLIKYAKSNAPIVLLFVLFGLFALHSIHNPVEKYKILEIKSADTYCIDFNDNRTVEKTECVRLVGVDGALPFVNETTANFLQKEITIEEQIANYKLAKIKLYELLRGKEVEVKLLKTNQQNYAQIFYGNEDLATILLKRGWAIVKDEGAFGDYYKDDENIELFKKNVDKESVIKNDVENFDYVLLNNKNLVYHEKDCRFGKIAGSYIVIKREDIAPAYKPCKVCNKQIYSKILPKTFTKKEIGSFKFFTLQPVYENLPRSDCRSEVYLELLKIINEAENSLDIAIYSIYKQPQIIDALQKAQKRGVKVRILVDGKNIKENTKFYDYFLKKFPNARGSYASENSRGIMHNKFVIADNRIVLTGSANFTPTDLSGFNYNNVIVFTSEAIAEFYTKEFEQMNDYKFGISKSIISNKNIYLNDNKISVCFSPKDSCIKEFIVPNIETAQESILMPTFMLTHRDVEKALANAHSRGVDVRIIVDAAGVDNGSSKHHNLRQKGLKIKTENFAGKVHSKTILIDKKIVIIGSMNFTTSGDEYNDENLLVIENRELAGELEKSFKEIWDMIPDKWLKKDVQAESDESIGSCADGLDNDYDGKIDAQDSGCAIDI